MRNFFALRGKWKGNSRSYRHQYGLHSFRPAAVRNYLLAICDLVFRVSYLLVGDIAMHVNGIDSVMFFINPATT